MPDTCPSTASMWFRASEATGDFMGIRYGMINTRTGEVSWQFVSHLSCDGIGGFARLLRERGAVLERLPDTTQSCRGIFGPLWRLWRGRRQIPITADQRAVRADWVPPRRHGAGPHGPMAWHLYTEKQTQQLRAHCKQTGVSVNSLLLKHLDQAVRPSLRRPDAAVSWMIPVNLRGDVRYADDTENHVSCVSPIIGVNDSAMQVHQQIHLRLKRGEHRAHHLLLSLGRLMSHRQKINFLVRDRARPSGSIGAFSNLGVWEDSDRLPTDTAWLFCPPVARGQLLGAGCVTFRHQLGLTLQAHPDVPASSAMPSEWMARWVQGLTQACSPGSSC